jgi:hypothetical protein
MQFIDPKGSFLKNLVLSVVLLGLGSLVIPIVLKQIDDRKSADQQRFQAELDRQDRIIDAQAELLDALAADFWNYELVASDVLYSRDERFGREDWHVRAVDAYYVQSGPLLGQLRSDVSTLLRLAPGPTYDEFLRLYDQELLPLDSCLLELMKIDATATATPTRVTPNGDPPPPALCMASRGRFAGSSWETLTDYVQEQDLAEHVDRQLEILAKAFGLEVPG